LNNKKINHLVARLVDNAIFVKILALFKSKYAKNTPSPDSIKKILIIKLEGMGDAVYLLEIIHRLKIKYPDIKIDVLTTEKVPVFKIFGSSSREFGVILINPLNLTDYYKTIKAIGKNGYNIIIDTTGMPVNIPLMLAFAKTSGTYIIGFDTLKIKKSIYDRLEDLKGDRHIFENYMSLFKIFNISQVKEFTIVYPFDNALDYRFALGFQPREVPSGLSRLRGNDIILVLSSNSGGLLHRRLPLANSVKLIKLLKEEFKDYSISLLGGPGDYDYLEEIKNAAESEYGKQDIKVEKTKTIKEAMVLLKNSFLNICIDSGLMHISSLVNPNTYCLFGYSDPKNSLPFNNIGYFWSHSDCSPCSFYKISDCADLKCMEAIDIDAVMDDIRRHKTRHKT
jgi:ADP-heptose:LPS heptosyltransferase